MSDWNDQHFTEEEKQLCPNRELLDTAWYDFADCPSFGSSDCSIAMRTDGACCEDREDVLETISYKYR